MRILVAIDSFKGCLSSSEAAQAVVEGLDGQECTVLPVSDGGEGFASVLTCALGGRTVRTLAHDPLGREIEAAYGLAGDTALIESAAASGLTLMEPEERDPLRADSRGTGELIADAIRRGARTIYVGFGGTGTNDGGAGMLEALQEVRDLWPECKFVGLCDVTAPFCGPEGASAVYGPQKGARAEDIPILDARLEDLAGQYVKVLGREVLTKAGSGAAGGMAGALWAVLGGELRSGADAVLDILHFEDEMRGVDMVVTGEGRIDAQTLQGKLPAVVARRARACSPSVSIAALGGSVVLEDSRGLFDRVIAVTPPGTPLSTALDPDFARRALASAAGRLVRDNH